MYFIWMIRENELTVSVLYQHQPVAAALHSAKKIRVTVHWPSTSIPLPNSVTQLFLNRIRGELGFLTHWKENRPQKN